MSTVNATIRYLSEDGAGRFAQRLHDTCNDVARRRTVILCKRCWVVSRLEQIAENIPGAMARDGLDIHLSRSAFANAGNHFETELYAYRAETKKQPFRINLLAPEHGRFPESDIVDLTE